MIQYISGDIFESTMQTLVVPVNTVGVMGAGLAKKFAYRYPEMEEEYKEECQLGNFEIGKLWIYRASSWKWILNFPTKVDWREPSRLTYIEAGLNTLVDTYKAAGIESLAFPKLGCGLGRLNWRDVQELFESYLNQIVADIEVFI